MTPGSLFTYKKVPLAVKFMSFAQYMLGFTIMGAIMGLNLTDRLKPLISEGFRTSKLKNVVNNVN